ncbi:hypothetical protein [Thalassotalea euphylliae]|uniref:Uncharacterized protein n=1 Tax=Thalassotalea euphylliae TaxID=1655234 RepID=A0A3E0U538_9GAMM|nr:hypothetical protein [Thalassotalea euphylliae]REL31082.1 hypothetical protein DXX94_10345 [Thalassotalea euphylliae]
MFNYVLLKDDVVIAHQESSEELAGDSVYLKVDELPVLGSVYDGSEFTPPQPPKTTKIHKPFFIKRLERWQADVEKAQQQNSEIRNDFVAFPHFSHVDFSLEMTQAMINRLVAEVKKINPDSDISLEAITADIQSYEAY